MLRLINYSLYTKIHIAFLAFMGQSILHVKNPFFKGVLNHLCTIAAHASYNNGIMVVNTTKGVTNGPKVSL